MNERGNNIKRLYIFSTGFKFENSQNHRAIYRDYVNEIIDISKGQIPFSFLGSALRHNLVVYDLDLNNNSDYEVLPTSVNQATVPTLATHTRVNAYLYNVNSFANKVTIKDYVTYRTLRTFIADNINNSFEDISILDHAVLVANTANSDRDIIPYVDPFTGAPVNWGGYFFPIYRMKEMMV